MASARRYRTGIAAAFTIAFLAFSALSAAHAQWVGLAIFLPCAAIFAFMTWLRWSRNQPVSFLPALLIGLSGRRALPPKNE